jgi:hypothetical protein
MLCSEFNFQTGTCSQVTKDFDFEKVLTYTDSSGVVIPITTDTFVMVIKDALDGSILLTLPEVGDNVTTGLYIPTPTSGVINIQITDTDVTALAVGIYPYEMTITDTDGKVDIFAQGTIQVIDRGF